MKSSALTDFICLLVFTLFSLNYSHGVNFNSVSPMTVFHREIIPEVVCVYNREDDINKNIKGAIARHKEKGENLIKVSSPGLREAYAECVTLTFIKN